MNINLPQQRQSKSTGRTGKSPQKGQAFATTPRSQSKQKKQLLFNLKQLMETNLRLKAENKDLKLNSKQLLLGAVVRI